MRRLVLTLFITLIGCPDPEGPGSDRAAHTAPVGSVAPVPSASVAAVPSAGVAAVDSEDDVEGIRQGLTTCPLPGVIPPGREDTPVIPAPDGVAVIPCQSCDYPMWESWSDCPRCAARQRR